MPDFAFYKGSYCGNAIQESAFPALAGKAKAHFDRFCRNYQMTGTENCQKMAICAMAEVLCHRQKHSHSSVTLGKVTWHNREQKQTLERALYDAAGVYVDFYRGVSQ